MGHVIEMQMNTSAAIQEPTSERWAASVRWERALHRLAKRTVDVIGALTALVLLAPVLVVAAVAVKLSSAGPVLYRQKRIGRDGALFSMLKFRTMYANNDPTIHQAYVQALIKGEAEAQSGAFKLANDPRITRVGRVLRRLSVDELPQLWNVVRGEMSLVGPRPPLPYEYELYDARARLRLTVPPGITGLWQVSGRNELTFEQMIDLDLGYIAAWSIWLDLTIVLRTPLVLMSGR